MNHVYVFVGNKCFQEIISRIITSLAIMPQYRSNQLKIKKRNQDKLLLCLFYYNIVWALLFQLYLLIQLILMNSL